MSRALCCCHTVSKLGPTVATLCKHLIRALCKHLIRAGSIILIIWLDLRVGTLSDIGICDYMKISNKCCLKSLLSQAGLRRVLRVGRVLDVGCPAPVVPCPATRHAARNPVPPGRLVVAADDRRRSGDAQPAQFCGPCRAGANWASTS
jgi:hypothetical protein